MPQTIVNVPGIQDVVVLPGMDDEEIRRERVARIHAHALGNPIPNALQSLPEVINHVDDIEDYLITALRLGKVIFPRVFQRLPGVLGWALTADQSLNAVNTLLGVTLGGRVPKLGVLTSLGSLIVNREARLLRASEFLALPFSWVGLAATGGQVLYNMTGYGLKLGGIMGMITDLFWGGIDLFKGRRMTIVLPPPSDLLSKAWRVLQWAPLNAWAMPSLNPNDAVMALTGYQSAISIVTEPPAMTPPPPLPEDYGYTMYRWDRFRSQLDSYFVQTATPWVDAVSELPPEAVTSPDDPFANPIGLPVRWPYNPVSSQQLTRSFNPYTDIEGYAEYWRCRQDSYVKAIQDDWAASDLWQARMAARTQEREAAAAAMFNLREAMYDYTTWYNGNRQLYEDVLPWQHRLIALAIEQNIFPGAPRNEYNYTHCAFPYDPPSLIPLGFDPVRQLRIWLSRAAFLYRNPGAPYWALAIAPGGVGTWHRIPYVAGALRGDSLRAASLEMWGAVWRRPVPGQMVVEDTANFQQGRLPLGISYASAAGSQMRRKVTPDNSWGTCWAPPPVPAAQCKTVILADGSFFQVCGGGLPVLPVGARVSG